MKTRISLLCLVIITISTYNGAYSCSKQVYGESYIGITVQLLIIGMVIATKGYFLMLMLKDEMRKKLPPVRFSRSFLASLDSYVYSNNIS